MTGRIRNRLYQLDVLKDQQLDPNNIRRFALLHDLRKANLHLWDDSSINKRMPIAQLLSTNRTSFAERTIKTPERKMRAILCVAMLALLVVATSAESVELYSDKYDYIDADEILANDRLREQYYNCFMDTAPCTTADMTFFKGNFAESMATNCKRCTEKQKVSFDKMADWFTKNEPEKWEAFVAKFLKEAKEKNAER